jgi:hypothetical protein
MSKIEKFASYFAGGIHRFPKVSPLIFSAKFMSKIEIFASYFAGGFIKCRA